MQLSWFWILNTLFARLENFEGGWFSILSWSRWNSSLNGALTITGSGSGCPKNAEKKATARLCGELDATNANEPTRCARDGQAAAIMQSHGRKRRAKMRGAGPHACTRSRHPPVTSKHMAARPPENCMSRQHQGWSRYFIGVAKKPRVTWLNLEESPSPSPSPLSPNPLSDLWLLRQACYFRCRTRDRGNLSNAWLSY